MLTNTSSTSSEMRRGTGEGSLDVLSVAFAAPSRSRISDVVREKAHSEGGRHSRNPTTEDADSGSQNQSWPSCSPKGKAAERALQERVSDERAIQETGTERS